MLQEIKIKSEKRDVNIVTGKYKQTINLFALIMTAAP